jgi:hypothetical protein
MRTKIVVFGKKTKKNAFFSDFFEIFLVGMGKRLYLCGAFRITWYVKEEIKRLINN